MAGFFVDETDLKLGRVLAQQFEGVMFPGHPDLQEVPRGTPDEQWLPLVARRRLAVITRDRRIRYRPVEKAAWLKHGVIGFSLTGHASQSTSDSLAILRQHWTKITDLVDNGAPGPWMYAVTSSGLRAISLI